jgi:hypothetical protein
MTEVMSKDELLARIHEARRTFWKEVGALSADQLGAPGVQGEWSVKDIVAHITAWEQWLLDLLAQAARGEDLSPRSWTSLEQRNDDIYREWKDKPLSLVLAEFTRIGVELHQRVEALSEEELFTAGRFTGPGADGLWRLIAGDTFRHYPSHLRAIQTWLADDSDDPLVYYACPGPVTHPHGYRRMFEGLPTGIADLVGVVQGLLLHPYWAERYGVILTQERSAEPGLRLVARQLARIRELDLRPLTEPRDLDHKLVGNCRDHSVLLTAMLRHQGMPARARCGFGAYFVPNHYEDHWVAEYWNGQRWVLVDAQLDALQRQQLGVTFDTLDVPRDQFVVAGQAWGMCRSGGADPDAFGIFDMHGWEFIRGNLIRDVLALNKVELLPWDHGHGYLSEALPKDTTDERWGAADRWARATVAASLTPTGDEAFRDLRRLYSEDAGFQMPAEWLKA